MLRKRNSKRREIAEQCKVCLEREREQKCQKRSQKSNKV